MQRRELCPGDVVRVVVTLLHLHSGQASTDGVRVGAMRMMSLAEWAGEAADREELLDDIGQVDDLHVRHAPGGVVFADVALLMHGNRKVSLSNLAMQWCEYDPDSSVSTGDDCPAPWSNFAFETFRQLMWSSRITRSDGFGPAPE